MIMNKEVIDRFLATCWKELPDLLKFESAQCGDVLDVDGVLETGWLELPPVEDNPRQGATNWIMKDFKGEGTLRWRVYIGLGPRSWWRIPAEMMRRRVGVNVKTVTGAKDFICQNAAFIRAILAWKFDPENKVYERVEDGVSRNVLESIHRDIKDNVLERYDKTLVQTMNRIAGDMPEMNGIESSKHDQLLSKYLSQTLSDRFATRRLLLPVLRAWLTSYDPVGREWLLKMDSHKLLIELVTRAGIGANDCSMEREMLGILFSVFGQKIDEFDHKDWLKVFVGGRGSKQYELTLYASIGCPKGVEMEAYDILSLMKDENFNQDQAESVVKVIRCYEKRLKDQGSELGADLLFAKGVSLCALRDFSGCDLDEDPFYVFAKACEIKCAEWDERAAHTADVEYWRAAPAAVKAPREFMACVASEYKNVWREVLEAGAAGWNVGLGRKSLAIERQHVIGLSSYAIYAFGDGAIRNQNYQDIISSHVQGLVPYGFRRMRSIDYTDFVSPVKMRLMLPADPAKIELGHMVLEVSLDGTEYFSVLSFPYFPKENPANERNLSGRIWEAFLWREGIVADVRIETSGGRQLYATMPWWVYDCGEFVRGMLGVGVAVFFPFACAVELADGEGYFSQGVATDLVARSITSLRGTVVGLKRIDAVGLKDIMEVELDCGGESPLKTVRMVVSNAVVSGSRLAVGAQVTAKGWMYVDFYGRGEEYDDYVKAHPHGVETKPAVPQRKPGYISTISRKNFEENVSWHVGGSYYEEVMDGVSPLVLERLKASDSDDLRVDATAWNPEGIVLVGSENGEFRRYRVRYSVDESLVSFPEQVERWDRNLHVRFTTAGGGYQIEYEGFPRSRLPGMWGAGDLDENNDKD